MNQVFTYKEKFAFSYFYPSIAFIALTVGCFIFEYDIAAKNIRLLAYPNSIYVLSICAAVFLAFGFSKLSTALKSGKNPNPIEIGENTFSFPKNGDDKVVIAYTDITKLSTWCSSDTGNELTIHTATKKYTFKEDNFENSGKYNSFTAAIRQKHERLKNN